MARHRDPFGRDKASQRRQKIRQPTSLSPLIVLKRGDAVRWEGHEGVIERITGDMAEITETAIAGRVWRLPIATLSRR